MARDDFTEPVKRESAFRAGHSCSNPDCRARTSGPQSGEDGTLNLGEAAHISAASPGGPRFDPALSPDERSSLKNSIWLCRICARRIDADPNAYPTELLREWKRKGESLASNEIGRPREPAAIRTQTISDMKQAVLEALAETGANSQNWVDVELESVVQNIKAYRYEGARSLLQNLHENRWTDLSDHQKFRVLTNLATTFLAERNYTQAAELYRDAKRYQPDQQKAWENEALAHELLGEKSEAVELARKIRERWPDSIRAVGIIVANLPLSARLEQVESEIPANLAHDAEICMILSQRAAMARDFVGAEKFARQAFAKIPDRPYAAFLVGQSVLASVLAESWKRHAEVAVDQNSPRLAEAEEHLSRAISLAKQQKALDVEAQALASRSTVFEIRGDKPNCEKDIEEAYRLLPSHPPAIVGYSHLLHSRGHIDRAIAVLREAIASCSSEEGLFLLSTLLRERGSPQDLKEALSHLCTLATTETELRDGFREHLASCAMFIARETNDFEQVDQLLDRMPKDALSATALDTLSARLAIAHDQQKLATQLISRTLEALSESASADDRRNLAMVLCQLSRFDDALPLWQQIAPLDVWGSDTKYLLDCALRAERYGVVLDVCKALRANGIESNELFDTEMFVLERYFPTDALQRLQEEVLRHPSDRLLLLRRSIVGLRLNRPDVVISAIDQLPPPNQVSPHDAILVVAVLRSHGDPNDGVKYAYEVLRLHFNNPDAHRAYVTSMGPGEHGPTIPTFETEVSIGCAVRFVAERSPEEQWTIIEDSHDPDPVRNETSPDSSLAKELLRKRVGDSFDISPFSRGTVKEITSKFVFRYQDCIKLWQIRFSDTPDILSFQVGQTGTFESDFAPILEMMQARRNRTQEVERLYSTQTLPIHIVAQALNVDDFVALAGLANSQNVLIRCCDGSQAERDDAHNALQHTPRLVVDITAIGSLILLDRFDVLDIVPLTLVASSGTVAVLEQMLREQESSRASSIGSLVDVDGKPQFRETTEDEKLQQLEALKRLIETVKRRCDILNCKELVYLAPEKRKELVELFGQHGAESIVLASASGSALWTDDLTVASYAKAFATIPRVWTQVILGYLYGLSRLDGDAYHTATANLQGGDISLRQ
jgi:tetratricopeptide (TPR) repeat protein